MGSSLSLTYIIYIYIYISLSFCFCMSLSPPIVGHISFSLHICFILFLYQSEFLATQKLTLADLTEKKFIGRISEDSKDLQGAQRTSQKKNNAATRRRRWTARHSPNHDQAWGGCCCCRYGKPNTSGQRVLLWQLLPEHNLYHTGITFTSCCYGNLYIYYTHTQTHTHG